MAPAAPTSRPPRGHAFTLRVAVGVALAALFAVAIVRYAWVAEDAYITLRTVDNLVHGHGPRWNVDERVQVYTHPLWMLLVSLVYAVTREDFLTLIAVGAVVSVAAFALVQRLAASTAQALVCGAILLVSPAYVDFSTSGLENPLSHLLVALFASLLLADGRDARLRLRALLFVAALCLTNRLDLGLLVLPAVAVETLRAPIGWRARLGALAIGAAPFCAWELFAVVYYGFALPNTAYAKLATGLPAAASLRQGLAYFASHVTADPATLAAIAVGLGLGAGDARLRALAAGVTLYLVYVVRVGGDFMLGRFLTPPLLLSTIVLGRSRAPARVTLPLGALVIALGLWAPRTPLRAPLQPKPPVDEHGLADERLIYAERSSLAARRPGVALPSHYWAESGRALRRDNRRQVIVSSNVGFLGYFAGPLVHIIDANALTDPLLARLPIAPGPWRIGHFTRAIPDGYVATVGSGRNQLRDPAVARLWDDVARVTRGPLFGWDRLAAAVRLARAQPLSP